MLVTYSAHCKHFPSLRRNLSHARFVVPERATSVLYGCRVLANPTYRAAQVVTTHANSTTENELKGMRIAATSGDNRPAAATLTPTRL